MADSSGLPQTSSRPQDCYQFYREQLVKTPATSVPVACTASKELTCYCSFEAIKNKVMIAISGICSAVLHSFFSRLGPGTGPIQTYHKLEVPKAY